MTITVATLKLYAPGVYTQGVATHADPLVERVITHLISAQEMVARAKAQLFKVNSHHPTYAALLPQSESKRKRNAINKHVALRVSYKSAVDAYEFHLGRVIDAAQILASSMPELIKDRDRHATSSNTNAARECNTVLISRFLSGLEALIKAMDAECKPKDISDVAHASSDQGNLRSSVFRHDSQNLFDFPLEVVYVPGTVVDDVFSSMDACLVRLTAAEKAGRERLAFLQGAKSRYFNDEQFATRLAEAGSDAVKVQAIIDENVANVLDFDNARWAGEMAGDAIWKEYTEMERLLKEANQNLSRLRYDTVLCNNIIAAHCASRQALAVRRALSELFHERPWTEKHSRATAAMRTAFEQIPAVFKLPRKPGNR